MHLSDLLVVGDRILSVVPTDVHRVHSGAAGGVPTAAPCAQLTPKLLRRA
jgi:hypothetical protein